MDVLSHVTWCRRSSKCPVTTCPTLCEANCGHFVTYHMGTPGGVRSWFRSGGQNVTVEPVQHSAVYNTLHFTTQQTVHDIALYNKSHCKTHRTAQHATLHGTARCTARRTLQHGALHSTVHYTAQLTAQQDARYNVAHCTTWRTVHYTELDVRFWTFCDGLVFVMYVCFVKFDVWFCNIWCWTMVS
jgi:hypothetical protein